MKPGRAKASVASIYQMAYQDLRRLEAVCSDFQRFCATCEHLQRRWGANSAFGVRDLNFTSHFREIHVDKVSRCIIPPNVRGMIPVTATGDGNCLFNSASLAICQKETLALVLSITWERVSILPWDWGLGCEGVGDLLGEVGKIGELTSHHCSSHSGGLTEILPLTHLLL